MSVQLIYGDCLNVMKQMPSASVHGIITDPPYGQGEFDDEMIAKLRTGGPGCWRKPRAKRSPVPRFFMKDRAQMLALIRSQSTQMLRLCLPGAHAFVASTPAHLHVVTTAFADAGWQIRTTVIRLVATLRGGDRPKNAHVEFSDCTVLPRSQFEPWLLVRKPCEGSVANNLRKYGTGALKRLSADKPFGDVVASGRTPKREKFGIDHPTIKPLEFIQALMRCILPSPSEGVILDCFSGSGTTAIAALRAGRSAICIERDAKYFRIGSERVNAEKIRLGIRG